MTVFNLLPNSEIEEVWEWKTDVLTTIKGDESRLSIRDIPRISMRTSFGPLTDAEKRNLNLLIVQNIKIVTDTPVWPYVSPINQTTSSGAARVYFDNDRVPVADDGYVILYNPNTGAIYGHVVDTTETDGATLSTNVAVDITTQWLAILGFQAKIKNDAQFRLGQNASVLEMEFEADTDIAVQRPGSSASLTTLDSLNVLERKFFEGASENYEYPRETLDWETGTRADYSQWLHARISGSRSFITNRLLSPTDFDYWRLFFDTVKGSWKPFLLSTQQKDMTLNTTLSAAGTSMSIVEDIDADMLAFGTWKHFEIVYSDKTYSYHTITSATGTGPVTVNFTPALPNDAKVTSVSRISHLLKCRMADRVTLTHGTTATQISFDITTTDD